MELVPREELYTLLSISGSPTAEMMGISLMKRIRIRELID